MNPLLQIQGLRKSFGQRLLFQIETLSLEVGCAYVLTGANGTGKSTLLRILAGLEPAEAAGASFCGEQVRLTPYPKAMRQEVVYVHQHPVMFSTSVEHNIGYGLAARGAPKNMLKQRVEEAMEWAGVTHLRNHCTATLSGGEKQRIALARARVLAPKLLLLDEPTANLDGHAKEQVISLIPSFLRDGGSMIIACHDRDLIAAPGIRHWKLRDGRLRYRRANLQLARSA